MTETASWPRKCATNSPARHVRDSRPAPAASASPRPDRATRSRPARPLRSHSGVPRARPPRLSAPELQACCDSVGACCDIGRESSAVKFGVTVISAASSCRNFKFKNRTRIIKLLVPLLIPKFASEVPQVLANFGIGALAAQHIASHIGGVYWHVGVNNSYRSQAQNPKDC